MTLVIEFKAHATIIVRVLLLIASVLICAPLCWKEGGRPGELERPQILWLVSDIEIGFAWVQGILRTPQISANNWLLDQRRIGEFSSHMRLAR